MEKKVVIIGAGAFARAALQILDAGDGECKDFDVVGTPLSHNDLCLKGF